MPACTAARSLALAARWDSNLGRFKVQMQAWAVGRAPLGRWLPEARVKGCLPPLRPTRWAKPPTGTRREPVANWRRSWRRCFFWVRFQSSMVRQKKTTSSASGLRPPATLVCRLKSATSTSRRPDRRRARSVGDSIFRASARTVDGTAAWRPRAMARRGPRSDERSRQSTTASTNLRFDSTPTTTSSPPGTSSTRDPGGNAGSVRVARSNPSSSTFSGWASASRLTTRAAADNKGSDKVPSSEGQRAFLRRLRLLRVLRD
mmetsp:Transcript_22719/g.73063  ORF Transcript_22719/g.73063 Transcript_22719/m.73063 type:complete len:260 (+) Transcript_22719:355-1134(+)